MSNSQSKGASLEKPCQTRLVETGRGCLSKAEPNCRLWKQGLAASNKPYMISRSHPRSSLSSVTEFTVETRGSRPESRRHDIRYVVLCRLGNCTYLHSIGTSDISVFVEM